MIIEPERAGVQIVLIGAFNPPIFTPAWLEVNGLIAKGSSDGATVDIVHRQISQFQVDWLSLTIQPERFQASTTEGPFVRLLDFILRTFGEVLPHTPVRMMGINRDAHFNLGDQRIRDKIGKILAPPSAWGEWADQVEAGADLHGGMTSLTMQQRFVKDRPRGWIQARVEPSYEIPNNAGIYINVNDHYEANTSENVSGSEEIMATLAHSFDRSIAHSEWIMDQVLRRKDD